MKSTEHDCEPTRAQARNLGQALAPRAAEFERLRQLPEDVSRSLVELGVFRMFVPRSLGGNQLPLKQGLDVLRELSYWDGAVGWCSMIGATTSLQAAFLEDHWAAEIYGPERGVTGGVAEPRGRARPVDGGIEVTGEWSWGSGTFHCGWIGGGCLLASDQEGQAPQVVFAYFERQQVELLDTWYTSGLRGSGSTDFRVERAFVPAGRWVVRGVDPPRVEGPLYRFPNLGALALGVATVALGMAERAVDELRSLAQAKSYVGSRRLLAERPAVQAEVALAESRLLAASAFIDSAVDAAWSAAELGEPTVEQRRRLRMAATHGMQQSVRIVDAMFHLGGGAAVYETSPLQRLSRDVHVAATHGMVAPRTYELYGRLALGLETNTAGL